MSKWKRLSLVSSWAIIDDNGQEVSPNLVKKIVFYLDSGCLGFAAEDPSKGRLMPRERGTSALDNKILAGITSSLQAEATMRAISALTGRTFSLRYEDEKVIVYEFVDPT